CFILDEQMDRSDLDDSGTEAEATPLKRLWSFRIMSTSAFGWSLLWTRPRDSGPSVNGNSSSPGSPTDSASRSGSLETLGPARRRVLPIGSWVLRCPGVTRRLRILVLTLTHILVFTAIYLLAYRIRFDELGHVPPEYRVLASATLPLVVSIKLMAFFL